MSVFSEVVKNDDNTGSTIQFSTWDCGAGERSERALTPDVAAGAGKPCASPPEGSGTGGDGLRTCERSRVVGKTSQSSVRAKILDSLIVCPAGCDAQSSIA